MAELAHNSYFEGKVQSVGYERNGRKASVGVIVPGEFNFDTAAPERMTVVSGAMHARMDGSETWALYAAGTNFEIPGNSAFFVRVDAPCAYYCEYL
ncbi:RmlC-like cupin domain-containing protein [Pavlovales sp. CCMP2436]|nr:RmlC-like cupin domain-containing protein [Pavlovales sp. CCMP2436]|mmetsp:Transcript_38335/g.94935  ORF Transcript_38335/g.94935 Transcript_38335/m.94935 type:complete len:96 (-) Transcript_38335:31-318(-)